MSKRKIIINSFESLGYNPEVMKKFGYDSVQDFIAVEGKISAEQMKLLKICNTNANHRSPKRSVQILDMSTRNA